MPCCIIAVAFMVTFIARWNIIKVYFGYEYDDGNPYGWNEYCELDEFAS